MSLEMGAILKQLRLEKQATQEEVGKVIGVSKATIMKYEKGIVYNMKRSSIAKLADYFGVSPTYLMGLEEKQPSNILSDILIIPLIGKIRAGEPILATENIEEDLFISSSMYNVNSADGLFFLRVIGDSMNKVISHGGYALIKQQDYAENGDIIVAIVNNEEEATLKRFKQLDNNFIMLEPDSTNDEYKPIIINLKETNFKILGVLIGIHRIGKF